MTERQSTATWGVPSPNSPGTTEGRKGQAVEAGNNREKQNDTEDPDVSIGKMMQKLIAMRASTSKRRAHPAAAGRSVPDQQDSAPRPRARRAAPGAAKHPRRPTERKNRHRGEARSHARSHQGGGGEQHRRLQAAPLRARRASWPQRAARRCRAPATGPSHLPPRARARAHARARARARIAATRSRRGAARGDAAGGQQVARLGTSPTTTQARA